MKAATLAFVLAVITQPINCYGQGSSLKIEKRVQVLINRMVKRSTEHKAFAELEALGCPAVPAIIQQMDDRRLLPDKYISLRNKSPQAWESMRHYSVKRVVDALDAILNQLTGQSFGYIDTDKDEASQNTERAKVVLGWREWLQKTAQTTLCEGA
jgi:hypothetical protein